MGLKEKMKERARKNLELKESQAPRKPTKSEPQKLEAVVGEYKGNPTLYFSYVDAKGTERTFPFGKNNRGQTFGWGANMWGTILAFMTQVCEIDDGDEVRQMKGSDFIKEFMSVAKEMKEQNK